MYDPIQVPSRERSRADGVVFPDHARIVAKLDTIDAGSALSGLRVVSDPIALREIVGVSAPPVSQRARTPEGPNCKAFEIESTLAALVPRFARFTV